MKYLSIPLMMLALSIVLIGYGLELKEQQSEPKEQQKVFTNSIGIGLVYIRPGEFMM